MPPSVHALAPPMMNNKSNLQLDPLYVQARQILQAQPEIGKARLAALLGVKTPTSRRLRERWRGETQGHSTHPDYVRVQQLKQIHPEWGAVKVAQALDCSRRVGNGAEQPVNRAGLIRQPVLDFLRARQGGFGIFDRLLQTGRSLSSWCGESNPQVGVVRVRCLRAKLGLPRGIQLLLPLNFWSGRQNFERQKAVHIPCAFLNKSAHPDVSESLANYGSFPARC